MDRAESAVAAQSIRVSVNLLETLMTMVSELVLTRNQLLQMVRGRADSEFKGPLQRLSLVTTELQEGVMKTRMQPIGNAWSKLPRLVRAIRSNANTQPVRVVRVARDPLARVQERQRQLQHLVVEAGPQRLHVRRDPDLGEARDVARVDHLQENLGAASFAVTNEVRAALDHAFAPPKRKVPLAPMLGSPGMPPSISAPSTTAFHVHSPTPVLVK